MAAIPTILKGDDSGAIQITLATGRSYLGATLVVAYQGVTRSFTNLNPGQTVNLIFTHEETAGFSLGTKPMLMRLIGQYGAEETVENADARIKVTDCMAEVNAGGSFIVRPGEAGSDPTKVPITDVGDMAARFTMADLQAKVNQIIRVLAQRSLMAVAVALLGGMSFGDIAVQSARLDSLYNDAMVVTNVTGGAGIDTNAVKDIVASSAITNAGAVAESKAWASLTYSKSLFSTNFNVVSDDFGLVEEDETGIIYRGDSEWYGEDFWRFDGVASFADEVKWDCVTDAPNFVTNDVFTTATNELATAITNKADKSELADLREKTDLSVYIKDWDLSQFEKIAPHSSFMVAKNSGGAMTVVRHSGQTTETVCGLIINQSQFETWYVVGIIFNHAFDSLAGTEIHKNRIVDAGYNLVTNAYTKSEADGRYLQLSGGDVYGELNIIDEGSSNYKIKLEQGSSDGPSVIITDRSEENLLYIKNRYFVLEGDGVSYTINIPEKDGTFAITSDIPTDIVHQSIVEGTTYTNATQILSTAENTAGTIATNVVAANSEYVITANNASNIVAQTGKIINVLDVAGPLTIVVPNTNDNLSASFTIRVRPTADTSIGSIKGPNGETVTIEWLTDALTAAGTIKATPKVRYIEFTRVEPWVFMAASQEVK